MVKYYIDLNNGLILEQLLCLLDIKQLDIDLTIQLCRTNHLQDTYVYIWNTLMLDYISPIFDAIKIIKKIVYNNNNDNLTDDELKILKNDSYYIYPYISYILTNRQFPTDKLIDPDFEISSKLNIYYILFNGNSISWPKNSEKLHIMDEDYALNEPAFPYLFLLLKFDSCQMFACLNEAFEDDLMNDDEINYYSNGSGNLGSHSASSSTPPSSLVSSSWNTNGYELKVSRQYIIEILLGIFNENSDDFTPNDKTYLAIFIARNYPKYNQFLRLSDYILDDIIDKLCKYTDPSLKDDCELSLQSLLSIYKPTHIDTMIPIFEKVGFYNALLSIYRSENKVLDLLELWLKTKKDTNGKNHGIGGNTEKNTDNEFLSDFKIEELFNSIPEMIEACILSIDSFYKIELENLFKDNLEIFISTNPIEICKIFNRYLPSISIEILKLQDSLNKYYYIKELINLEKQSALSFPLSKDIKFEYIKLLNEYEKPIMKDYILSLDESLIDFEKLVYFLKQNNLRSIVYEIYKKERKYEEALDEVIGELDSIGDELIEKLDLEEHNTEQEATLLNTDDDYYKDIELKLWDYLIIGFDVCEEYQKFERSNTHNGHSNKNKKKLTKSESMLLLITETNVKLFIRVNRKLIHNIKNEVDLLTDTKEKIKAETHQLNDSDLNAADKLIDNDVKLTSTQSKIIGLIKRLVQDSFYNLINLQGKLSPILNFQNSQSILDSIKKKSGNNDSFLRIFSEFLNRSSSKVTTLGDVRSILNEIFLAYSYEENILGLSLKLLNEDIYKEIELLESKEQAGWSLNNLECEICGKKLWGSHINNKIFELWQEANFTGIKSNDETKDFEMVVFRCRHGYHTKCLHGMGVNKDDLLCILCRTDG
ncbi:unnamed protein product [[Candida] boidinii]|nr:unnamed protein product [[Candida] boidinii]